jgi:hypothetical protein
MSAWVAAATKSKELDVGVRPDQQLQKTGEGDRAHEQHGQEEQPAAEEDRGEQAVFDRAELVADDADEPEEGNAGNGTRLRLNRIRARR